MAGETNVVEVSKYLKYFNDQSTLRRSEASAIPLSEKGNKYELKGIIKKHFIKTVELEYTPREGFEMQMNLNVQLGKREPARDIFYRC